jgi:hypothetical protein
VPIHHSCPACSAIVYLNFNGGNVTGTQWNIDYHNSNFMTLPYNPDGLAGFSSFEQDALSNIWRRVAEDYAPWQIDVTTERPALMTSSVAVMFITRSTAADGALLPVGNISGGVAYFNVFGNPSLRCVTMDPCMRAVTCGSVCHSVCHGVCTCGAGLVCEQCDVRHHG